MEPASDLELPMDALMQAVGFPSFDEYKKNPEFWREKFLGHKEEILAAAEGSTKTFLSAVSTQRYMWRDQYDCGKSLEKLHRICQEEGFSPDQLEMEPIVRPIHGTSRDGQVEILIRFWPKSEWELMGKVTTT